MRFLLMSLLGMVLLAGCSSSKDDKWTKDRPQTFKVTGMVVFDSGPLEGATVAFRSTGTKAQTAVGRTDADGRFVLQTFEDGDGAVAGSHQVTVTKIITEEPPAGINLDEVEFIPKETSAIPKAYGNMKTSDLMATVEENDENEITLVLNSK